MYDLDMRRVIMRNRRRVGKDIVAFAVTPDRY